MWYSNVTNTGPRSGSTSCVVMGAAQCMEGEKSTAAPGCSFHRQVSGIAINAPAAAANRAADTPASVATSPQKALPRLMAPKNTVTKTASPRPRTHSGRASCAETFKLDTDAIQPTPATKLAAIASTGSCEAPNNSVANAVPMAPAPRSQSAPSLALTQCSANVPLTA